MKCGNCGTQSTDPLGWKLLGRGNWRCPKCWRAVRECAELLYIAALRFVLNGESAPLVEAVATIEDRGRKNGRTRKG